MHYMRLLGSILAFAAGQVLAGPLDAARAAYSEKDYRTASRLYLPLAQGGDATAQFNLGVMYDEGQGVPKDDQQALYWFRKSANQGCPEAQFTIGIMYATGQGVSKDFTKAALWYRKAADQDFAQAQRALADLYSTGQGVPRSATESRYWNGRAFDREIFHLGRGKERSKIEAAPAAKEAEKSGAVNGQDPLRQAKRACADIGFKPSTEKYGDCILQMIKVSGAPGSIGVQPVAQPLAQVGDGSQDDISCQKYGFVVGGQQYSSCRLQIDLERKQTALIQKKQQEEQRQFEEQKALLQDQQEEQRRQYEEQKAAYDEEMDRQRRQRLLELSQKLLRQGFKP